MVLVRRQVVTTSINYTMGVSDLRDKMVLRFRKSTFNYVCLYAKFNNDATYLSICTVHARVYFTFKMLYRLITSKLFLI